MYFWRTVYCPHAGHKKNAWPVVPAGKPCGSSLLLFSNYPTFPDADISRLDTFSVTHATLHFTCEQTERSPESRRTARLRLSDCSNTCPRNLPLDFPRQRSK